MRGTIRERKSKSGASTFQVLMTVVDPETGTKRQVYGGSARTRSEAEVLRARLALAHEDGRAVSKFHSVDELLDRWLEDSKPFWSVWTRKNTPGIVAQHVRPEIGRKDVRKVRTPDLNRLFVKLHAQGSPRRDKDGNEIAGTEKPLAASSVRRIHANVQAAFGHAVELGWIDINPADGKRVRLPKDTDPFEMYVPSVDELRALIAAADLIDADFGAFIRLVSATGARRSELLALHWRDVDLDAGTIYIAHSLADGGGDVGLVEGPTKTRTRRTNSLGDEPVARLAGVRARAAEAALACGMSLSDDAYVFSNEAGGTRPWRPDLATKRFAQARDAAGLPKAVLLHGLRHYVATHLLDAGMDETQVARQVGHRNAVTTRTIYAHRLERSTNDAAARTLDALLDAQK